MVSKPIDGKPATHANGGTIGFTMASPEQAEAWHKAGVANGGTSIEDPPGIRQGGAGPMYLAYLRDPDGNKLCAVQPHAGCLNRLGQYQKPEVFTSRVMPGPGPGTHEFAACRQKKSWEAGRSLSSARPVGRP